MRSAWSELSPVEANELQGDEKLEFDQKVEFAPLHWAAFHGNLAGVTYLLVNKELQFLFLEIKSHPIRRMYTYKKSKLRIF